MKPPIILGVVPLMGLLALSPAQSAAQSTDPTRSGRAVIEALTFEPMVFEQPAVSRTEIDGVDVLHLEDRTLPLVTVHAYFRGGYGLFEREKYAAAMGLPAMLRYGGTATRSASDVDEAIAYYAHQLSFGSAGGSVTSSLNTLTQNLQTGLDLWSEMLTQPGFDQEEIAGWRTRQLEGVARDSTIRRGSRTLN